MSIQCKFPSSDLAKKAGWFSRRHQNRDAHDRERDFQKRKRAQRGLPMHKKDLDIQARLTR